LNFSADSGYAKVVPLARAMVLTLAALSLLSCGKEPETRADASATATSLADTPAVSAAKQQVPENQAVYISMQDGVRIAAEIWLPAGMTGSDRLPTLVSFTRYWRASAYDPPQNGKSELFAGLNQAGYAVVVVDTRGSGASFGSRATEFSVCETRDFKHVIDWVAEQHWSNGRVATIGVSYSGNTAEHATFDPSPALRAAIPRFTDFDGYSSILYPGGLRNKLITDTWGAGVNALDNNLVPEPEPGAAADEPRLLGVKPVDIDSGRTLLEAAVKEHASNLNLTTFFARLSFRDEIGFAATLDASTAGDDCAGLVSPYRFRAAAEASGIPTFHWASWVDAGTASGVLARFSSYDAPARYLIGPWTHGAGQDAGVFKPADTAVKPGVESQYGQILEFLEPMMRGDGDSGLTSPSLTYFTMGEDRWKTTASWPPAGHTEVSWYLADDQQLAATAPAQSGTDEYAVDFEAGTGELTRWTTQLGGKDIFHGDRAAADQRLLTYTSPPLPQAMEITGHPRVELYVSSTHEDGALIAYLESVAPDGVVTMITEGELRLVHRKVSDQPPPYPTFGPYHSFERADALPMVPGETSKVEFVLWPTSVLIPAGHALRLAIAGHDKDTFARYPEQGDPVLQFQRGAHHPSQLVIPVILNH
jgi:putative CocE/NonD family hydrolase